MPRERRAKNCVPEKEVNIYHLAWTSEEMASPSREFWRRQRCPTDLLSFSGQVYPNHRQSPPLWAIDLMGIT